MTSHLSSQELVGALDKTLDAPRQSHLDGCAACQTEVRELRALVEDARQDADVPEPSP
jgi:anti-sigma factor RsiW